MPISISCFGQFDILDVGVSRQIPYADQVWVPTSHAGLYHLFGDFRVPMSVLANLEKRWLSGTRPLVPSTHGGRVARPRAIDRRSRLTSCRAESHIVLKCSKPKPGPPVRVNFDDAHSKPKAPGVSQGGIAIGLWLTDAFGAGAFGDGWRGRRFSLRHAGWLRPILWGASAAGWERSLTGLSGERCDTAAAASEFDAAVEPEATAEDEAAMFFCA